MDDGNVGMTVREAGRRGGERVKAIYGEEYFASIGKIGGRALREKSDDDFYAENGRKGGSACRKKHGRQFYAKIGQKGGEALKEKRGNEHYSAIGKMSKRASEETVTVQRPIIVPGIFLCILGALCVYSEDKYFQLLVVAHRAMNNFVVKRTFRQ